MLATVNSFYFNFYLISFSTDFVVLNPKKSKVSHSRMCYIKLSFLRWLHQTNANFRHVWFHYFIYYQISSIAVNNLQLSHKLSCFEKLYGVHSIKEKCHLKYEIIQVFLRNTYLHNIELIINFVKRQSFCVLYFVVELQCHKSHGFANHNILFLSFAESCLEWRKSEPCLEEGWLSLTLPQMAHHQLRTMKATNSKWKKQLQ